MDFPLHCSFVVLSSFSYSLALSHLRCRRAFAHLQVSTSKMGILYGIFGMAALIAVYWANDWYTYEEGVWLVAVAMAPGALFGLYSSYAVGMTSLPEMVAAYNGFGGLAAALEGIGLYLDPTATYLVRHGQLVAPQTNAMVRYGRGIRAHTNWHRHALTRVTHLRRTSSGFKRLPCCSASLSV